MTALVVAFAILAQVPAILVYPHIGILTWYFLALMNPHRMVWGFVYSMPFSMIVAVTTLGAWIFSSERKRIPFTPPVVFLLLIAAWITVTTSFAELPEFAWPIWERSMKVLLMAVVTVALMQSRERIHALVWLTVISLGAWGAKAGVSTILGGGTLQVFGPRDSFIADNNTFGLALVTVLPLLRYLYIQSAHRFTRLGVLLVTGLTLFGIVGTQSRGAFLALLVVGLFLLLKSRRRLQLSVLALVLAISVITFVPESWIERMESIERYEQDASAQGRLDAWTFAFRLALQRPLTGGGFEVYRDTQLFYQLVPEAIDWRAFHSIFFDFLGAHGFIGLALFLLLLLTTWRALARVRKACDGIPDTQWAADLASMAQVSLVGYAAAGAFLSLSFFDLLYLLIALAVLLEVVAVPQAEPKEPRLGRNLRPALPLSQQQG